MVCGIHRTCGQEGKESYRWCPVAALGTTLSVRSGVTERKEKVYRWDYLIVWQKIIF